MEPATTGDLKPFNGTTSFSIVIPLAKAVELLCGLSFLTEMT
jgi:hypothetical protein